MLCNKLCVTLKTRSLLQSCISRHQDSVVSGLFQPLFSQLIPWFTKDRKHASLETECILTGLIQTICDNNDASRFVVDLNNAARRTQPINIEPNLLQLLIIKS